MHGAKVDIGRVVPGVWHKPGDGMRPLAAEDTGGNASGQSWER